MKMNLRILTPKERQVLLKHLVSGKQIKKPFPKLWFQFDDYGGVTVMAEEDA